jgi:putative ABC transport system substrate-binding protein
MSGARICRALCVSSGINAPSETIPIVFINVGDPVGFGLVASLAHPGGNLTGFSNLTVELEPKQLELLCELIP